MESKLPLSLSVFSNKLVKKINENTFLLNVIHFPSKCLNFQPIYYVKFKEYLQPVNLR